MHHTIQCSIMAERLRLFSASSLMDIAEHPLASAVFSLVTTFVHFARLYPSYPYDLARSTERISHSPCHNLLVNQYNE